MANTGFSIAGASSACRGTEEGAVALGAGPRSEAEPTLAQGQAAFAPEVVLLGHLQHSPHSPHCLLHQFRSEITLLPGKGWDEAGCRGAAFWWCGLSQ